jgi:hypothetical protein
LTLNRAPATDLGFLLHKHPDRLQTFSLPFGSAHVFHPEVGEEPCTDGKSSREARCLKRYLARNLYRLLQQQPLMA